MTNLLASPGVRWAPVTTGLEIQDVVERLFRAQTTPPEHDQRKDKRIAYPQLLTLTPIDDGEFSVVSESLTVVGKYLAARGFDFFHCHPLPFRRAIVSFDRGGQDGIHLVLNIAWCRFLRPGWYDSGGRFTHIVQVQESESTPPGSELSLP